jgi:Ca-activated chloride channel family protein
MDDDDKLGLSRRSLSAFIEALDEQDRFEVIAFNVQASTAFGELRGADAAATTQAAEFLSTQQARGGTVLRPAVQAAYKYASADRALNVIILSDGLTEQNERAELVQLIRQRPKDARVFCIGVGNDVNRALLEQLATDSGGLAAFISREDNFERQAGAFRRKLLRPVATDLQITFDGGGDVYDVEPAKLPNLYHGMPVRLYGRYRDAGNVKVNVRGAVLGQQLSKIVELELPERDDVNPEIERMWAWHRVDALLKNADADGSRSGVIPEIIRLGERYSIVTEYTSFIVLENDGEYQRWKIDRNNALRTARDRRAHEQLAAELQALRERAAQNLGPANETESAADLIAMAPAKSNAVSPSLSTPSNTAAPAQSHPRRRNLDFGGGGGGGGGGGAIDPFAAVVLLTGAGAAIALGHQSNRRGKGDLS